MKVVWLSWKDHAHPQSGGAEVVKSELAKRLAAAGHELTVITSIYPGAKKTEAHDGYTIIRVPNPMRLGVYWYTWRYYRKHFAASKPDIVIDEMNTLPFFARFYSGTATILFAHQLARQVWFHEMFFPLSLVGYLLEPLYIRMLSKTSAVTVSESSKADLICYGFAAKSVHVIPQGITMQPLKALPKPFAVPAQTQAQAQTADDKTATAQTQSPKPSILAFGAIRSMKGTLDAVKAFELAKQKLPDLQLVVAGPPVGKYGQKVLSYIKNSQYATDITVHGKVTPEQKRQLMQESPVIISAARKEGWGLTISEAASQGALPIVYDIDGLRDAVYGGKGGIIVRPNPQALAEAIYQAFTKDQSGKRLYAFRQSKLMTFDRSYAQFEAILRSISR